jgi:hypothetical protein
MPRLIVLYPAMDWYIVGLLREELYRAGVGNVLLNNEIPQYPGYTFGANSICAYVLIDSTDREKALAVLEEVVELVYGGEPAGRTAFPSRINIKAVPWVWQGMILAW